MQLIANLSMLFTELPLLERIGAARQAGFDAVEIQFPYEVSPLRLQRELEAEDMSLVLFNVPAGDLMEGGPGLACQPKRQRKFAEALDTALEYAAIAKPEKINVLAGRLMPEQDSEQAFMTLAANLREAARAFSRLHVQVLTEAINPLDMSGFFLQTPQQQLDVLREVKQPNCKAQLDIYHMARQGIDPLLAIAELGDAVGHVQFADCPGRNEPGSGTLNFVAIREQLQRVGYTGGWAAEYRPLAGTAAGLGWMSGPAFVR